MSNAKTKQTPQIERFREKARELECDESDKAFEAVVRKVAKTPPKKAEKAKPKKAK
jgi:hypothetical protein